MNFLQCDLLFIIKDNNCGGNVFEIIAHKPIFIQSMSQTEGVVLGLKSEANA